MKLVLTRFGFGLDSTLGELRTADGRVQCFTLEDERRKVKVPGETCIPEGHYAIDVRHGSPKFGKYDERWDWHDGMLWLRDVPGFEFVYIHPGNTDDDTDGCPLVGEVPVALPDGEFAVQRSVAAYKALYTHVREALRYSGASIIVTAR